jgi:glycosyltransferase A (GT-A) superfamily protein (DUF2064 family)
LSTLKVTIVGVPAFAKALKQIEATRVTKALQAGVYAMANAAALKAIRLAPKRFGVLRGSIHATLPRAITRTRVQSTVGAGGPAAAYARAQHEGTNGIVIFRNYTTPGTGPEFITRAIEQVRDNPDIFGKAAKKAWATLALGATANVPQTPNEGPKTARRSLIRNRRRR